MTLRLLSLFLRLASSLHRVPEERDALRQLADEIAHVATSPN